MKPSQEVIEEFKKINHQEPAKEKFYEEDLRIGDLYPDLTRDQQEEADWILGRYLSIVREIFYSIGTNSGKEAVDNMPAKAKLPNEGEVPLR